jgi:xylan 1,4-beta-xylosidase
VRFHGIFNDEMGVFAPSILTGGKTEINFQNVFQVYDGILARGVSPFIELSFMPKGVASGTRTFFGYNGNITPPKSNEDWAAFITQFAKGLIARYSIEAVRNWPFEVWNEPNLAFFWSGNQQQYFDMYKATAVALKQIDPRLQVGGPATSAASWVGEFASFCATNNAPVDFFSTHSYAGDKQESVFGPGVSMPQNDVIPAAMAKARRLIDASPFAGKPLWLGEWGSDSPAMIAHVVANCLPYVQGMSHWTMSGVYEELGAPNYVLKEGDMGWGQLVQGIARPGFNTYKLLHGLGDRRLEATGPVLASRRADGRMVILVWNLAEVPQAAGIPGATSNRTVRGSTKEIKLRIAGGREGQTARVQFVDQVRGSPMPAWRDMGSPQYPSSSQMEALRRASEIPKASTLRLGQGGSLSVVLPPEGVALIEI